MCDQIRRAVVRQYVADLAESSPAVLDALRKALPQFESVLMEQIQALDVTSIVADGRSVLYVLPDRSTYRVTLSVDRVAGGSSSAAPQVARAAL